MSKAIPVHFPEFVIYLYRQISLAKMLSYRSSVLHKEQIGWQRGVYFDTNKL